jgi:hypothetical protein
MLQLRIGNDISSLLLLLLISRSRVNFLTVDSEGINSEFFTLRLRALKEDRGLQLILMSSLEFDDVVVDGSNVLKSVDPCIVIASFFQGNSEYSSKNIANASRGCRMSSRPRFVLNILSTSTLKA